MKTKEPRISVRVTAALKERIEKVTQRTGVDETTLVRACLEALCDHVERNGKVTFPLALDAPGNSPAPTPPPQKIQPVRAKFRAPKNKSSSVFP